MRTGQRYNTALARAAVTAIFFINGAGYGNWVARIPAVRDSLGLDTQQLGLALLGVAIGSLLAMPFAGALLGRVGSRAMTTCCALAFCATVVLPALAVNLATLTLALVALGATTGTLDVSMNGAGAAVERHGGRAIMSSFHAAFSFGGLSGAALGGFLASREIAPLPHLAGIALLSFACAAVATRGLLPIEADGLSGGPAFALPTRALAALGIIGFGALLSEGAMADWSGIYLRDIRATDDATAASGFAAFSLCMAIGRLTGDWLVERFGAVPVVRGGGVVAAAGLALVLLVPSVAFALVGFAAVGIGISIIFPLVLSAAARTPNIPSGTAIAAVTTIGYLGFLAGPPVLGIVAHATTLGVALWLVVLLCAGIAAIAGAVGGRKADAMHEQIVSSGSPSS